MPLETRGATWELGEEDQKSKVISGDFMLVLYRFCEWWFYEWWFNGAFLVILLWSLWWCLWWFNGCWYGLPSDPLVNVYVTIGNLIFFLRKNSLFLWPCSVALLGAHMFICKCLIVIRNGSFKGFAVTCDLIRFHGGWLGFIHGQYTAVRCHNG